MTANEYADEANLVTNADGSRYATQSQVQKTWPTNSITLKQNWHAQSVLSDDDRRKSRTTQLLLMSGKVR